MLKILSVEKYATNLAMGYLCIRSKFDGGNGLIDLEVNSLGI